MSVGTIIVLVVVVLAVVLGLGYLILTMMRRSQTAVPRVADADTVPQNRIVATDEAGRPVRAFQESDEGAPRDSSAFEAVLKEELDELDIKPDDGVER